MTELTVGAQLESIAKCHTGMSECSGVVTEARMLSLAQVSLSLNYSNVIVKNHAENHEKKLETESGLACAHLMLPWLPH